ncbi:MAG: hypothetical protein IPH42_10760 [Bacteroidetes bacterium]|nr:hypothetical protein [Bacteroidota bacterium]
MKFHLIIIFLLTANLVFTQAPDIQWQKNYGGSYDDIGHAISNTSWVDLLSLVIQNPAMVILPVTTVQ